MYQHNTQDIVTFFSGLLNKKLVQAVAKSCGYPAGTTMDTLGKKGIAKMITAFKDFSFDIPEAAPLMPHKSVRVVYLLKRWIPSSCSLFYVPDFSLRENF